MDVKEITQKIIDTYKVAQPLYENHTPLYGSDVPICPPYEKLYVFFVFLQDHKPEILADILGFITNRKLIVSVATITYLNNYCPEEYKFEANTLVFMLTLISEYRKYKSEKNDSSN